MDFELHTCVAVNGNNNTSKYMDFIKNFVSTQSDLLIQTNGSVYDRLITHGIEQFGYQEIIQSWPSKPVIMRHMKYYRSKIRPPLESITPENKSGYIFADDIVNYQNQTIMHCGPKNEYVIFAFKDTLSYLTEGKNVKLMIDGTMWSAVSPLYDQLCVIMVKHEQNGKCYNTGVAFVLMSDRKESSYTTILSALNQLVKDHCGCKISSPLVTTDAEKAIRNSVLNFFDSKTVLKTCSFHVIKNTKDKFNSTMKSQLSLKNPLFNAVLYQYYIVTLKLHYLPEEFAVGLISYLIQKMEIERFHDNEEHNLIIKSNLKTVLLYLKKRFTEEGNLISWYDYIMSNRNEVFVDSTSSTLERLNGKINTKRNVLSSPIKNRCHMCNSRRVF